MIRDSSDEEEDDDEQEEEEDRFGGSGPQGWKRLSCFTMNPHGKSIRVFFSEGGNQQVDYFFRRWKPAGSILYKHHKPNTYCSYKRANLAIERGPTLYSE